MSNYIRHYYIVDTHKCIPSILGTEIVTNWFEIDPHTESATLKWNSPMYTPQLFELKIKCRLLCENFSYHEVLVTVISKDHNFTDNYLKPGSSCSVTFLAVFNPGRYDHGLKFTFETLAMSECYAQYINTISNV